MPYLNCPNCGLTVTVTRSSELIEHCPRCLARTKRPVELFVSAHPRGRRRSPAAPAPARAAGAIGQEDL
jgi:ribosomal protein L37AE/L43A